MLPESHTRSITLPQGEAPEFPDLPPQDLVDDLGDPHFALTFDPFAQDSDDPNSWI